MQDRDERWTVLEELEKSLQKPMLVLSFVWLLIVLVELIQGSNGFLTFLGTLIWIVFVVEFLLRFLIAPHRKRFLSRNWLTLLALLLPALRLVRGIALLRATRALRGFRLVRIVGSANRGMTALQETLRRRQFGYVMALTLVVLFLGAAGMWSFEPADTVKGGFTSYTHALWWTGMLIASIGTDYWPVTAEGRLLSSFLAIYGLAVFGYITATFASFFIGRDAASPKGDIVGGSEIRELKAEILQLRRILSERSGDRAQ